MEYEIYIGIDPGASGAIACIVECENVGEMHGFTETATGWISFAKLHEATPADIKDALKYYAGLLGRNPYHACCVLERVGPMRGPGGRKQGVGSTFKFGMNFGILCGCVAALEIPHRLVTAAVWQKTMGCQTRGDKNISKAAAQRLFPQLKITHANADALLLAEYCRRFAFANSSNETPAVASVAGRNLPGVERN